ncbi:hypothetical protein SC206_13045 [Rouxiella sp. T17]
MRTKSVDLSSDHSAWRRSRRFALPSLRSQAKNVLLDSIPRRPEAANHSN